MSKFASISVILLLTACGGPIGIIPGGRLSGEEASANTWTEVISDSGTLDLETRPADPYSIRVGFILRNEHIYLDPAEDRDWYQNLKSNPSVRVRFGNQIYRAVAVPVTDPTELEGFDTERRVQRLELVR